MPLPDKNPKSTTRRLSLRDPRLVREDEEMLKKHLGQMVLSEGLMKFLHQCVQDTGIEKKINIPSGQADVAVAIIRTSGLEKNVGLIIIDELRIFFDGKTFVEKWKLGLSKGRICILQISLEIHKVHVNKPQIRVELRATNGAETKQIVREYDFSLLTDSQSHKEKPHPLG
ncbi:MAG: hypothetical protein PHF79_01370 [Candidatus Pacebacteria bacterium]|nr:hypothetical protein [Candidatus Paceibacterota bacterium]